MYEEASIYPMRGESCYHFFKECEYLQVCTLSTDRLTSPLSPEDEAKLEDQLSQFQIHVTLDQLIESQLNKNITQTQSAQINEHDELL